MPGAAFRLGGCSFFSFGCGGVLSARRRASSRRLATSSGSGCTVSAKVEEIIVNLQTALDAHNVAVAQLLRLTHANLALVIPAIIDSALGAALEKKMVPLSSEMKRRLFDGYGPLSYVANKIDLAFAFGLITQDLYSQLRVVNKIRTKFAHSPQTITFLDENILDLVRKLPAQTDSDYYAPNVAQEIFKDVLNRLTLHLDSGASSP